jgi:tetratricopeptide (TPR) repeat protein
MEDQTTYKLARDSLRLGDLDKASRIAEAEIQRLEGSVNSNELWRSRFIRAEILVLCGRVGEALRYLESLAPPDPCDVESCARLKMHRGYCAGYLCRYEASHQLLGEAEIMARKANLHGLVGDICLSRAFILFRQKDYVSSDLMYRSVLAIVERAGCSWYYRGHALWGIGKNLMIQEHYNEAMPWLEESLAVFEDARARLLIAMVWSELAVCHLGLGDDVKALDLLRRAERGNREAGAIHNYQVALANIGNVYLHRRDYFGALSYYQRALSLAREIKDPVSIKRWTRNINLAYARIRLSVDQQNPRIA